MQKYVCISDLKVFLGGTKISGPPSINKEWSLEKIMKHAQTTFFGVSGKILHTKSTTIFEGEQ